MILRTVFLKAVLLASALSVFSTGIMRNNSGRTKFGCRESHLSEETARILNGGHLAFFFGYTIFHCRNQVLSRTFDPHYGEETKGDKQHIGVGRGVFCQVTVECGADTVRDFIQCAAAGTAAGFMRFYDAGVQNDRIDSFKDSDRKRAGNIRFHAAASAEAVRLNFAFENTDVALAAEQNDFLFYCGNAFEFLHVSGTYAGFECDFYVNLNKQLIESTVKWYGIDVDTRPDDLCTFCTDNIGAVNDVLSRTGKIYLYIFETVLVTAGIENPVSVNAYEIPIAAAVVSAFSHFIFHAFP